ncbi:MAG: phosphatidylserine synthase [Deltaproteobacteria bacterium]|nr:MAG: phosphatidylserine synthase [Deltaproteobacteria bacterium]
MERISVIIASVLVGLALFYGMAFLVKREAGRNYVLAHGWLLHPNAICYWRAALALVALYLYFGLTYQNVAILIFTVAAILDGVDGIVARACNLVSRWGEWLDPFCDKLTYLPPLIGFAYAGILDVKLVWILVIVEFVGQFFARHILKLLGTSGAANNFGKIKAIICFGLVIFCALIQEIQLIIDISDEILISCIVLSAASLLFKFIPNKLYADILSSLNFCCGLVSLYLASQDTFTWAILVIILGQLFDLFDGRMALKHGGTKYGPYLDDIADFISFGLAPAFIIYRSGGGTLAVVFALLLIFGVAFRLIRFVAVDKKRTDLPDGIFNGLPSPAGALIVLGGVLVAPPHILWMLTTLSVALMVSHVRFAHFGRIILKHLPRPLFFVVSATIIVCLAYILKTKSALLFGYLILASVGVFIVASRKWVGLASRQ